MLRAPDFWWRGPSLPALALAPLGALHGLASGARMRQRGGRASLPVVCVGNLVVGGAGKTPAALALARLCRDEGLAPGFLSRGHGGRGKGPMRVDPGRHDAREVGDEPLLLAAEAPTIVARDRAAGARRLADMGLDLIVMDDGFQNPALAKDLALVVVDGASGIGNGFVLPAGPLRAPLDAQLARADALVLVGDGGRGEAVARTAEARGLSVLRARLAPVAAGAFSGLRCLAFAGIGRPGKFFATLEESGAIVAEAHAFPDHHVYSPADCAAILARAEARGFTPVTTAKDMARLKGGDGAAARLAAASRVLRVELVFEAPEEAMRLVMAGMARARATHA